jgi:hypothetical protein
MALRLHPQAPLGEGVRAIVLALVDRARTELGRPDDRALGVHEARKVFKKARAVTRLVRSSLGPRWREEDRFWRQLGHALAAERDAEAVIQAYDLLLGKEGSAPQFRELRELLERRHRAIAKAAEVGVVFFPTPEPGEPPAEVQPAAPPPPADDVEARLAEAATRVASWTLPNGFGPLAKGIEESYRRAHRRLRQARRLPSAAVLHRWRRAVKQHAVQVGLLRDAAPGPLGAHLEVLDALVEVLGEDHDLAVLRALLTEKGTSWGDPETLDAVLVRMARRHAELHRVAFSLGERGLAESPAAFRRRLRAYWKAHARDTVGERAVFTTKDEADTEAEPDEAAG